MRKNLLWNFTHDWEKYTLYFMKGIIIFYYLKCTTVTCSSTHKSDLYKIKKITI